jgi:polyisoprenoid-binding protein YceI
MFKRKTSMFIKIRALLLLTIVANTAVNADSQNTQLSTKDEHNVTNMALLLKEHLYEIQQDTSTLEFRVDSPVGEVWGSFQDFEGSFIMANNGTHNQSAVVDINASSLDADASFIRAILVSEIFFDVEKFPSMRFIGSSFEWFNDTQAVLKGYLTIHDITQPVAFYIDLVDIADDNNYSERITVKASTTIQRSEFGIYSLLPAVSDKVNLFMHIDAVRSNTAVSMM